MAKPKLGSVKKRVSKRRLERKEEYPKKLLFLEPLPFSAVATYSSSDSDNAPTRVEFTMDGALELSRMLRSLERKEQEQSEDISDLVAENESLKKAMNALRNEHLGLQRNFDVISSRLPDEEDDGETRLPSPLARLEEETSHPKSFQGGAPGSGKKK